jgi:ubiquinone biosynthesis protein UbiJ
MLERAALSFFNHLLLTEGWALTRLKPFSGQHARFDMGPLSFGFSVSADGSLHPVDSSIAPEVAIRLPDDTPFRILNRLGFVQIVRTDAVSASRVISVGCTSSMPPET